MSRTRKDTKKAKWALWDKLGVKSWPVPKSYKQQEESEERAWKRELIHRVNKDPEHVDPPRKRRNDHKYYW